MKWYVAVVPAQKEFAARDRLKDLGYQVMVPVEYKWRRRSRHTRTRIEVPVPLMPRYVFLGTDRPLYLWHLRRCPLIQAVLGSDGVPRPLPPEAVKALQGLDRVATTINPHRSFRVGDDVQIVSGPLRGRIARLRRIMAKRARVMIEVFASMREIEVPVEILEAA